MKNEVDFEEIHLEFTDEIEVKYENIIKEEPCDYDDVNNSNIEIYGCSICSEEFKVLTDYQNHACSLERIVEIQCENCRKSFEEERSFRNHSCDIPKDHEGKSVGKSYKCGSCSMVFKLVTPLKLHCQELGHKYPYSYICEICSKKFPNQDRLEVHKKRHENEKPCKCEECGMAFKFSCYLRKHLMCHSKEKYCLCEYCGKEFAHGFTLKEHMTVHTDAAPHVCELCGKEYRTKRFLVRHLRYTHPRSPTEIARKQMSKKMAECEICKKRMTRPCLATHMMAQHGDGTTKYKCPMCEKGFNYRTSLDFHINSHTRTRNHECEECGKAFGDKSSLRKHVNTHLGVKPYSCKVCDRKFAQSGHLLRHMRIHTKEKPVGKSTDEMSEDSH